ncbi:hypothetical protein RND81_13G066600 [Saponaria officinalis]|uniref:40S ribosomal protein S4 n=1 Tax=Saponaria officinalis TaxID=3572 RepID=A0AAW1H373_SAPOF
MARGLKKHLKRLNAPKHWMLDKLGGAFAPKPSSRPHKSRECLPLILILRNRLKYALNYREVVSILMQRHILVDGKIRTDKTYPAGFYKLCKVRSVQFGQKGIPYLNTYDGRTIRYPDSLIKANDTIKFDLESQKTVDFVRFDVRNVVMVTGGRNRGRVGVIKNREKTRVVSRLSISKTLLAMSLLPVRAMFLSSVRVPNLGFLFPRARVLS